MLVNLFVMPTHYKNLYDHGSSGCCGFYGLKHAPLQK